MLCVTKYAGRNAIQACRLVLVGVESSQYVQIKTVSTFTCACIEVKPFMHSFRVFDVHAVGSVASGIQVASLVDQLDREPLLHTYL